MSYSFEFMRDYAVKFKSCSVTKTYEIDRYNSMTDDDARTKFTEMIRATLSEDVTGNYYQNKAGEWLFNGRVVLTPRETLKRFEIGNAKYWLEVIE